MTYQVITNQTLANLLDEARAAFANTWKDSVSTTITILNNIMVTITVSIFGIDYRADDGNEWMTTRSYSDIYDALCYAATH